MAEELENKKEEMGLDEFKDFVETLKNDEGLEDDEILEILYKAFEEGSLDLDGLKQAADALGYELNEDFEKDMEVKPENLNKDSIEAAKEIGEDETPEEFRNRIASGNKEVPRGKDDEEDEEDSEEDEKEKAMKYFG